MSATTEETLALVEGLARIVAAHRLDKVSVAGVEITRSMHITPEEIARAQNAIQAGASAADDDDLLFDAVGGPPRVDQ